jgi:hypothetical protein
MKTLSENPPEGFQYESGLAEAYHTPPNSKVQLKLTLGYLVMSWNLTAQLKENTQK